MSPAAATIAALRNVLELIQADPDSCPRLESLANAVERFVSSKSEPTRFYVRVRTTQGRNCFVTRHRNGRRIWRWTRPDPISYNEAVALQQEAERLTGVKLELEAAEGMSST
jgi:hypothetical protein